MKDEVRTELREIAERLALVLEAEAEVAPHVQVPPPAPDAASAGRPAPSGPAHQAPPAAPVRRVQPVPPVRPTVARSEPQTPVAIAPAPLRPAAPPPPPELPADLDELRACVEGCTRCALSATRTRTVFGEGPIGAKVMFVGEGPGEQEDLSGRPFVGPAGQLLDRIIESMKLVREECYIANVVKCRPPNNRTPTLEWTAACGPYLERQIAIVRPSILVALGTPAGNYLTGEPLGVVRLRGRIHRRGDIPLVVTYHPAALLREPSLKRLAWEDMKMVMARLQGL